MITLKNSTDVRGLHRSMWDMLYDIEPFFRELKLNLVITSGLDGDHSRNSLHYVGCAVDIRTRDLEDINGMFSRIKSILNPAFDIVLHKTHIHIEYQPKHQAERILNR